MFRRRLQELLAERTASLDELTRQVHDQLHDLVCSTTAELNELVVEQRMVQEEAFATRLASLDALVRQVHDQLHDQFSSQLQGLASDADEVLTTRLASLDALVRQAHDQLTDLLSGLTSRLDESALTGAARSASLDGLVRQAHNQLDDRIAVVGAKLEALLTELHRVADEHSLERHDRLDAGIRQFVAEGREVAEGQSSILRSDIREAVSGLEGFAGNLDALVRQLHGDMWEQSGIRSEELEASLAKLVVDLEGSLKDVQGEAARDVSQQLAILEALLRKFHDESWEADDQRSVGLRDSLVEQAAAIAHLIRELHTDSWKASDVRTEGATEAIASSVGSQIDLARDELLSQLSDTMADTWTMLNERLSRLEQETMDRPRGAA